MTGSKIREEQLEIKARDGSSIDTFLSMPAEVNARGGILVIQEIWGVTDFIRTVCRKLSEIGYMAMAPHLYSRADEKALFTEENIMDAMRPFWALPPEKRGDQKAVSEILEKLPEHTRKIVTKVMFERENREEDDI